MTKRQALEECVTLWKLVKKLGVKYKKIGTLTEYDIDDIKSEAARSLGMPFYEFNCPCCEYSKNAHDRCDCPLASLWGSSFSACIGENSPYGKLDYNFRTANYTRYFTKWCDEIINGAKTELKRMGETNE